MSIFYTRDKNATDVSYVVEYSLGLADNSWLQAVVTDQVMGTTDGVDTIKASMAVPEVVTKYFMRLKVEKIP